MLDYEPFNLSIEAQDLARLASQNLTGKKRPKPSMNFFVYAWTPGLQLIVRKVVNEDLADKLKEWSRVISIRKSVVTLQRGHSLETPEGKRSIIIAFDEGVEGQVAIHNEEDVRMVAWRIGIGYILQELVSIRAIEHDITMMMLVLAPESQGANGS